ncbi:glycosyltransferase family 2 protein [Paenibacillus sp. LHD-38]|uniref:glycosyltransferase family 2 protein n=1 Tax=Paenibacillus sp. LHD-38 TaxID=3072143 RepID=UPI00280D4FF7|nr:glycosyltransferase family 2 protein [Paenibacillus sp. LHD-38]MDQ8738630.1 glycosyltransferase family 2 protein [Paenibacillus sp. LHD-38]
METPFMSVCIPTYNRAERLADSIRSVLEQSFQDFELVIVDNRSTDHTEAVVASFDDDRIRFIVNEWNIGAPANHNRCLIEAKGKYIKFLHSDDTLVIKEALQRFYDAAVSQPNAGIITCCFTFNSEPYLSLPFDLLRPKGFSSVRECMNIHSFGLPSEWMVKREILPYTGLLIDSHICDVDFVMKSVFAFDTYSIAEPLVNHTLHEGSETTIASSMNGWEFMRFKALEQLPYYSSLSVELKNVLCNYLHMTVMVRVKKAIEMQCFHFALQGVLDLLKMDPQLHDYEGEAREKVLSRLLHLLVLRKTPTEIVNYMHSQNECRSYAHLYQYGIAFRHQLYSLEKKIKESGKQLQIIGDGGFAGCFLDAFPELKTRVTQIIKSEQNIQEESDMFRGIPTSSDLQIDFSVTFAILGSDVNMRKHRYALIKSGLVEGEHFLPLAELI